jgi:hypothetical protein
MSRTDSQRWQNRARYRHELDRVDTIGVPVATAQQATF